MISASASPDPAVAGVAPPATMAMPADQASATTPASASPAPSATGARALRLDAAALRRALAGRLAVLVGGGGFVGRYLTQDLLAAGMRVRVAQRSPRDAALLRASGDLGQTQFVRADLTDRASLDRAVAGADVVVNLVGVLAGDFTRIHVHGARALAEAATAAGVADFVQVSAIGADPASASAYGASKGAGEAAVRAAFPRVIVVRPSIIFGREDQFVNRFAGMMRLAPVLPVVAPATRFQPVFVGDVAAAITAMLANADAFAGTTQALGGPEVMRMDALMRAIAQHTGRNPRFLPVPDAAAGLLAKAGRFLPGAPITEDQWRMLQSDNVVGEQADGFAATGIAPRPLAALAEGWLTRYRPLGRFAPAR